MVYLLNIQCWTRRLPFRRTVILPNTRDRHETFQFCLTDLVQDTEVANVTQSRRTGSHLDGFYVDDDLAFAKPFGQAVSQPANKMPALLPPTADKNATTLSYSHIQSAYRIAIRAESRE